MLKKICWVFTLLLPLLLAADTVLQSASGKFVLDEKCGSVKSITDAAGRSVLAGSENRYIFMAKKGDVVGYEKSDRVIEQKKDG